MSQARIKVNGPVYGNFKERSYFHIDFKIAACLSSGCIYSRVIWVSRSRYFFMDGPLYYLKKEAT